MTKKSFNLRNVVAIAICLAGTVMFSGCGKDDTEPKDPPKNPLTYDEGVVINGVKWATRNVDEVGTFTLTPESAGKFYQWNRKKAWNTTDSIVSGWDSTVPEGTEWEKTNDPSPAGWRVPAFEDFEKLLDSNKVTCEWITNPTNGMQFTDIVSGNSIFLPAAKYRHCDNGVLENSTVGSYWGSTTTTNGTTTPHYLFFSNGGANIYSGSVGAYGTPLRCVAK